MKSLIVAAALVALPALAQDPDGEGPFFAVGAGGAALLAEPGSSIGWNLEGRAGWLFNPYLQVFLSGSIDAGHIDWYGNARGYDLHFGAVMVNVQSHPVSTARAAPYVRAGIGVGVGEVPYADYTTGGVGYTQTGLGLLFGGGLGIEFKVSSVLRLAPEVFYRHTALGKSSYTVQTSSVGLQLNLVYY